MKSRLEERIERVAEGHKRNIQGRIETLKAAREECADYYNFVIAIAFDEVGRKWESMGEEYGAEIKPAEKTSQNYTLEFRYNNKRVLRIAAKAEPSPTGALLSVTTADFNPIEAPAPVRFNGNTHILASTMPKDTLAEFVVDRLEAALEKHLPER